ncbi:MAG TPA: hypothetical protein VGV89_06830 [Thermoplasmata archaeon]|nr:hypothetical protein [Thermoplasmata archaeon]
MTDVGRHVLRELKIRAYRVDALPLDRVSDEMGNALKEMDDVAKVAEFFLADLGPVTPPDALPYLRMSAAGLANRRTSPEELAETFRNTWGMVEVMEGDARDRLFAADLLVRSPVPASRLYAGMMHSMEMLRAPGGAVRHPVSTSALLHLYPTPAPQGKLAEWKQWRPHVHSDETAAILAGAHSLDALHRLETLRTAIARSTRATPDAEHAAAFLLLSAADPAETLDRMFVLASLLEGRLPTPLVASSLLVTRHSLSPEELLDWVDKAVAIVESRNLAPTAAEVTAIAIALVHGLASDRFGPGAPAAAAVTGTEFAADVLGLLALHAWIYRPTIEAGGTVEPLGPGATVPASGS